MEFDPASLLALGLSLIGVGVFAGILAGMLGVGGGIVIVPGLYLLFTAMGIDEAVKMHLAVGTSLATIIATALSSIRAHRKRNAVDFGLLRSWGPAVAVGALIGTVIATSVKGATLTTIFAVFAIIVAAQMAFMPEQARLRDRLPTGPAKQAVAAVIGGFSAMMGIGGGTLTVPTLTLCGVSMRRAVGTASAVGLIIALPGTLGFALRGLGVAELPPLTLGYVSVLGFALIAPTTVLTAPLGAWIAHTVQPRKLRLAFALFLLLTSARMLYGLFA